MEPDDTDRDPTHPALRIVLAVGGLLLALLLVAAIVRPDMVMPMLHTVMRETRAMVGM